MLDYRIETFITLCKERNYSKTAQILCITQPAVTQHIQYLERYYNCKLFEYENKQLNLTSQGKILERMALGLSASTKRVQLLIQESKNKAKAFKVGGSLSVSEYMIPPVLTELLKLTPNLNVDFIVDSSINLIKGLKTGATECIIIEGEFDKQELEYRLFSTEEYIAISSKPVDATSLNEVLNETLICANQDSGCYKLLTKELLKEGLTINDFCNVVYTNNLTLIKKLVKTGVGIAFIYKNAVLNELENGELFEIPLQKAIYQDYHFVTLKNNMFLKDYLNFYEFAKSIYHKQELSNI
ncbi:MAG: LysR family transcriptional regulator [bacterium]|nr:LysR family transcriptional regulator [bacterium]